MTKFRFRVVVIAPANYPHSAALSELSETLVYGLEALGHEVSAAINDFSVDAVNIILGAHLISEAMAQHIPAGSIIYNTEQFDADSAWMGTRLLDLIRQFETWDYSRRNIAFLSERKLASSLHFVPIGFVPQLARIQQAPKQDIDVLFYGSMNQRRAHILDALRAQGFMVVTAFNCYGDERDALIARAKVILNVHYYESKIFEIVRVSYLLTNHKAVVAEVGAETDMDPIFRDAVAGVPYDHLVETCAALVVDDLRRTRLEQRGFEIMSSVREEECLRPVIEARFMQRDSPKQ